MWNKSEISCLLEGIMKEEPLTCTNNGKMNSTKESSWEAIFREHAYCIGTSFSIKKETSIYEEACIYYEGISIYEEAISSEETVLEELDSKGTSKARTDVKEMKSDVMVGAGRSNGDVPVEPGQVLLFVEPSEDFSEDQKSVPR